VAAHSPEAVALTRSVVLAALNDGDDRPWELSELALAKLLGPDGGATFGEF